MSKQERPRRYQGRYAGKRSPDPPRRRPRPFTSGAGEPALSPEVEEIRTWLKQVRFKKRLFGGVDEADVWKKLGELNTLYERAIAAERVRCSTMQEQKAGDGPYE